MIRMVESRPNSRRFSPSGLDGRKVRTPQGSVPRNAGGSRRTQVPESTESATEKIPPEEQCRVVRDEWLAALKREKQACHYSLDTVFSGKGEMVRQERTGCPAMGRPGKPHTEQFQIGMKA